VSQVRAASGDTATLKDKEQGMAQMSEKFRQLGSKVYVNAQTVKESNKAL
jgi:phosphomethylpyrimidine synthase